MIQDFEEPPTAVNDRFPGEFTDERLMQMIQERSQCGLGLLHNRYSALLKAMSMNVLHNDSDAEDLLQDVFVEIWNRAGSYDVLKGRPLGWMVTLTRRRSIDRLRRREAYGRLEERFTEEVKGHTDFWTHVHEELALHEMSAQVELALATLPEAQRHVIKLTYHRQMTQREAAAHTGTPLGTIKTRLELGLKKMAVALRGHEELLGFDAEATAA